MSYKILVVEDEPDINGLLVKILKEADYHTIQAFSGTEAKLLLEREIPDAILLDLMLPGMSGEELLHDIRGNQHNNVPVLVISAKDALSDKVSLLKEGADDYVTKPFSMRILLKKVYVILSRKSQEANIYDDGFLKVDFELGIVQQGVNECLLSPTEYRILKKLIENKGKLLTYSVLLDSLWDEGVQITDKHTLAVNINRLRKKIETEEHSYISNVYGMGYIWK